MQSCCNKGPLSVEEVLKGHVCVARPVWTLTARTLHTDNMAENHS